MSNIRVYELAKKLGVKSKDILAELSKLGIEGKAHTSGIEPDLAKTIENKLLKKVAELPKETLPEKSSVAEAAVVPEIAKVPQKPKEQVAEEQIPIRESKEATVTLEEEEELKVPDRFKKEMEIEKIEKFRVKPGMQKAFQTIRKIEPKRWHEQKPFKRLEKVKPIQKEEKKPPLQLVVPRKKTLKLQEGTTVKEFAELI